MLGVAVKRRATAVVTAVFFAWAVSAGAAQAAWLQPVDGQVNAVGTTQAQMAFTQMGSAAYVAGVESAGPGSSQLVVRRYTPGGSAWHQVGAKLNFNDNALPGNPAIAVVGTTIYVAWQEQDALTGVYQVYVKRLEQAPLPNTWASVGGSLNPDPSRNAIAPDIAAFGGVAHISFASSTAGPRRALVFKEGSTGWDPVGGGLIVDATRDAVTPRLAVSGGNLTLAWNERLVDDDRLRIASFDSGTSTWQFQAVAVNDAEGSVRAKSVAYVDGSLTVAYVVDVAGVDRLVVKRFNPGTSNWDLIGDALNVTNGSARSPSIADIGNRIYVVHREVVTGSGRIVLSRLSSSGDQWETLPAFVGPNSTDSAVIAGIGEIPWVALVESAGSGAVWRLVPTIASIDVDADPANALAHVQSDLFGLPFGIEVDARSPADGTVFTGVANGAPSDLKVAFSGLAPDSHYEARVWVTDPLGDRVNVESLAFSTDLAEPAADESEPSVKLFWDRKQRGRPRIRGGADDETKVARVEVAIAVGRKAGRCIWVSGVSRTGGDCVEPDWQTAVGTRSFDYILPVRLAKWLTKRPYEVYARSFDAAGNVSEVDAYRCGRQFKSGKSRKRAARCVEWR